MDEGEICPMVQAGIFTGEEVEADNCCSLKGEPEADSQVAFFDALNCVSGDADPFRQLTFRPFAVLAGELDFRRQKTSGLFGLGGIGALFFHFECFVSQ